uniref:Uncharacterized protein n=1 Tax=Arundo donax TaxID=35708 RepID=A0A0A8Z253_ARUDO
MPFRASSSNRSAAMLAAICLQQGHARLGWQPTCAMWG